MAGFVLRFVAGGLLVALIPVVAARFSANVAGVALMFPVVTAVGLGALWLTRGDDDVRRAAVGGLVALPAVAAWILGLVAAMKFRLPFPVAAFFGMGAWLAVAFAAVRLKDVVDI